MLIKHNLFGTKANYLRICFSHTIHIYMYMNNDALQNHVYTEDNQVKKILDLQR